MASVREATEAHHISDPSHLDAQVPLSYTLFGVVLRMEHANRAANVGDR
jgi:hypothetical protein